MSNNILIGKTAAKERKKKISELLDVVMGNRGWRIAFVEKYPHFDTAEGERVLVNATRGTVDDPELLKCLEEFVPWVIENQPEWYKKQKPLPVHE